MHGRQHAVAESSSGSTPRRLGLPRAIEVRTDVEGEPVAVEQGGAWRQVVACVDRWTLIEEWWRVLIRRSYYEFLLSDERLITVYRDEVSGAWYAQRDQG